MTMKFRNAFWDLCSVLQHLGEGALQYFGYLGCQRDSVLAVT